jgi:hypothetical protein
MKRKGSFAIVPPFFAVFLSLSIGTLNASKADDLASTIFATAQTAKQQCISNCRALSRLSSSEPVAVVRVSRHSPRLHPILVYWFRTGMTASVRPPSGEALLTAIE